MSGADSTVAITISVREDGSVALIDAATGKIHALNAAGVSTTRSLQQLGTAGFGTISNYSGTAGAGIAKFVQDANDGLGKVHGNMRQVSGEAREMGLHMGWSMRELIAQSPAAMGALKALSGLFIGLAAVEIGAHVIEGVYNLYEKWFDVSKEVEAYVQKAGEAGQQQLIDTASLETATAMLKEVNAQVDELQLRQNAGTGETTMGSTGFEDQSTQYTSTSDEQQAKAMANAEKLTQRQMAENHQLAEERLKGETEYNTAVARGYAQITAKQQGAVAAAQQHLAVTKEHEQYLHHLTLELQKQEELMGVPEGERTQLYTPDPNAGNAAYNAAVQTADQQAAGQRIALARTEQQTVITAQNEAANSHLQGIALVQSQEEQAIDAVVRKFYLGEISKQGMIAQSAAIWEKFEAQKLLKMQEEQRLVDAAFAHAGQVGDTGTKAIRDEQADKIAAIPIGTDPERAVGLRVAYEQEGDNKVIEAREKFVQEMLQIDQRADDQMLQGYARIDAEAAKLITAAQTKFTGANKGANLENPADYAKYAAEYQAEQDAETRILANAGRERVALTQKTDEQISQMEAEAARATLPPWQAAQERIADEYAQRLAKVKEEVDQHVLTEQQGARAATAAWQAANNEIERQQQETRDKVAGELSSLFDNPAKYMEDRAKKLMFDILANWMMQLSEAKGPMGSTMAWIFGMNPEMSTSTNPKTALGSIFAPHHGAAGAGGSSTLSAAGSTLSSAGSTLNAAGSTLSSSGTMLVSAAQSLTSAAMAVGSMTAQAGGAGAGLGGGGLTPGGGVGDFTDMFGSGGTGAAAGGFQPSDINPAPTGATGVMGAVPGMASALGAPTAGAIGQSTSLLGTLASGGVFGSGAQGLMTGGTGAAPLLNPGGVPGVAGGFQPTDIAPTNSAGVLGTVPDSGVQGGGGVSAMGVAGAGMAALSGGMAMAQDWESGNTGGAVLTGAMTGASVGSLFGPIGMGIGAAVGALVGFIGGLFGDHGASKARQYNEGQVKPAITKEMTAYTAAEVGYDQGLQDMEMLQLKAEAQTKAWGSGAVAVYTHTIAPEINVAIAEMQRQQDADRSGAIAMQAAQYDSGGVIRHFGDLSTGPNSGFIHAQVGERMLDRMTNMRHSSTLDAMSRGADISRGNGLGLGNSGGGETHLHVHIHALDVQDFSHFLRNGGAQQIQSHLNANSGRYAGKALS